jgi:hypothetical protein
MQYAKALVLAACIARVASDTQEVARVNAPKLTWAMQGCSQGFDSYEATALVGSFVVAGGYTKGSCDGERNVFAFPHYFTICACLCEFKQVECCSAVKRNMNKLNSAFHQAKQ